MTPEFSPPLPPNTPPICYSGIINTMTRLHHVTMTEPMLRTVLLDIRDNYPDTHYAAIRQGFLRPGERWAILDAIGYVILNRSWPREEEGDAVLCGFLRQLKIRSKDIKLGQEWKPYVERAEKFCTKRRVAHLHL